MMHPEMKKKSPMSWAGWLLITFGGALFGAFDGRQIREHGIGITCAGFIWAGVALAIMGIVFMAQRRRHPGPTTKPPTHYLPRNWE